jgi:hypothetical protein
MISVNRFGDAADPLIQSHPQARSKSAPNRLDIEP